MINKKFGLFFVFLLIFFINFNFAFGSDCDFATLSAPKIVNRTDSFNLSLLPLLATYENATFNISSFGLSNIVNTSLNLGEFWKESIPANSGNIGKNLIIATINISNGMQCTKEINVTILGDSPNITAKIENVESRFGMNFDQKFNVIINNTGNATAENVKYYLTTDNSGRINNINPFSKTIGNLDNQTLINDSLILKYNNSQASDTIYLVVDYEFNGISQEQIKLNFSYKVDPVPKVTSAKILSVTEGNNLNHQLTWDYSGTDFINFSIISGVGSIDNETGLYTYNSAVESNYEVLINVSTTNYSITEKLDITVNAASSGGSSSGGSSGRRIIIDEEDTKTELEENIEELKDEFLFVSRMNFDLEENRLGLNNIKPLSRISLLLDNFDTVDTLVEYNYYKSELEDIKRKLIVDVEEIFQKEINRQSEINSFFEDNAQLRNIQSNFKISKVYVNYYNSISKIYTMFEREIDYNNSSRFVETLPRDIIDNANLIIGDFKVLRQNPIIEFDKPNYYYLIEGQFDNDDIDEINFVVLRDDVQILIPEIDVEVIEIVDEESKNIFSLITGNFLSGLSINETGFFIGERQLDTKKAYTIFMIVIVLVLGSLVLFLNKKENIFQNCSLCLPAV